MSTRELKALQDATIAIKTAEEMMAGAVKLYGSLPETDAVNYHTMAHAALDNLLDAARSLHRAFAAMVRKGGES